ncbi:hypothetical protein M569_07927 [Genlisea aurea]|uniref:Uncharacterized protein n=1 Tax=Genlisea aurea TaxID=192259 RepID=S8E3P7_9LAMI|nr:hypothetical protein M569_07927 [Genlisea aurea]
MSMGEQQLSPLEAWQHDSGDLGGNTCASTKSIAFDPSRMIGIIRRKALIRDLAAVYHAECLSYCQQLLELQNNVAEPFTDVIKAEPRKKEKTQRPTKRNKKSR